ncbi:MAG: hypothetical protein VB814_01250 [Pirellulaceae bacterium]
MADTGHEIVNSGNVESATEDLTGRRTETVKRHLRFGWWSLFVFVLLGTVLEGLIGFKWMPYMTNDTRQVLWRLAHAHGTLLGLVHIAFALTVHSGVGAIPHRWISPSLITASILLPGGFFAGGIFTFNGDPGVGVLVVPLGACFMIAAVLLIARSLKSN